MPSPLSTQPGGRLATVTLGGKVVVITTFWASDGPLLVTVWVMMIVSPAFTVGVESMPSTRSALRPMEVVSASELLAELASVVSLVTKAVFVMVPVAPELTMALRSIVTEPLAGTIPTVQVITPLAMMQLPWLADAVASLKSVGKVSVTTTFWASDGPVLETTIW